MPRIGVVLFLLTGSITAQTAVELQRAAAQVMEKSVARQRESVAVQARGSLERPEGDAGFFTFSWAKLIAESPESFADCDPLSQSEIGRLVTENAQREGLRPDVLREVMRRESAFRPCAVSKKGAQGLMQLMPATAGELGVTNPFDPEQNVAAGAKFLKKLLDRYSGDLTLALSAYNAGPGRVDEANGVPRITETQNYVGAILKAVLLE
jgi:soluble lytic murein transglycosylase-like protein